MAAAPTSPEKMLQIIANVRQQRFGKATHSERLDEFQI